MHIHGCSSETVPIASLNKPWGMGIGADFGQLIVSAVGVAPHLKETQFCTNIIMPKLEYEVILQQINSMVFNCINVTN